MGFNINNYLISFKENFIDYKKYYLIFICLLLIGSFSMLSINNIQHPKMEIIMLMIVSILGILIINYYFSHNSEECIHNFAFILIIILGLLCIFTMPILEPSDCPEHFTRAEITSRGILFPEYTGNSYTNYYYYENGSYVWDGEGFKTISSVKDLNSERYGTVFTSSHDNDRINHTEVIESQAFQQNPFYGYLPQAIGIVLAKFLDLNVIWMMWLARIGNMLCYAGIVSYAVKKSPIFKIPIIVTACLPMSMFQAVSVSSDSMVIALGILIISYFFYMYKSKDTSIGLKDISIFITLSLLIGLLKLPYLAFSLLIFAVPFRKFKNRQILLYSLFGIIIIGIIGVIWSNFATDALWHSYRATHYLEYNVNATEQLTFLLSDNFNIINLFSKILNSIYLTINGNFLMFPPGPEGGGYNTASDFITAILPLFMGFVYLAYPKDNRIELKSKLISLLVLCILYFGICFVQFLTWSPANELVVSGISPRYFLPFFILIPFIFGMNIVKVKEIEFDNYAIILSI